MFFEKTDYLFKIALVGDSGVGKSSLLFRFAEGEYYENFLPTIGVDFKIKSVTHEDKSIKLHIWDTAGQERYQTICCIYYKGADGIVIVYDITDRESFKNVERWVEQVEEVSSKNAKKILVGNKSDREDIRAVSYEEGKALADKLGLEFIETSAKKDTKVDEAFTALAITLKRELAAAGRVLPSVYPKKTLTKLEPEKKSSGTCCL